jgi:transposase-like protein
MSQGKKARVFSREFKLKAVEGMLAGESSSVLARELKVLRKLLYKWKDAYISGGPAALRTRGRPHKDQAPGPPPEARTARAELLQARQRIAELERKVGKQQLEIDFFAEALRRVDAALEGQCGQGAQRSIRSSESKHRKAD